VGPRYVAVFGTEGGAAGKSEKFDVASLYRERALSEKLVLIPSLLPEQMMS